MAMCRALRANRLFETKAVYIKTMRGMEVEKTKKPRIKIVKEVWKP